jgi:hypothetical protein
MRARASVIAAVLLLVFALCGLWGTGVDSVLKRQSQSQAGQPAQAVYASDPNHIWNRLFRLFYVRHGRDERQYGGNEIDPYLWPETKYLLSGSSHKEALELLDQFLQTQSETLVADPLKRALFQRDLLAVYDWLSSSFDEPAPGRTELQKRVAEIIRRLALSEDEIRKLPDNYDDAIRAHVFPTSYDPADSQRPFLPDDLFAPKGPWVCLGEAQGHPVASDHLEFFHGRSIFLVFFQVPGGRAKTLDYLSKLRNIPKTWGANPDLLPFLRKGQADLAGLVPYPEPPQFPIGTRMALVRQIVLVDSDGHPIRTQLTESVQMRVYRAIHFDLGGAGTHSQDFFEFTLSRERLLSGQAGGLRAVAPEDKEFSFFRAHGNDIFESDNEKPESQEGVVLLTCSGCHEFAGMHSFLSYSRHRFGAGTGSPPKLIESRPSRESAVEIRWIEQHEKRIISESSQRTANQP